MIQKSGEEPLPTFLPSLEKNMGWKRLFEKGKSEFCCSSFLSKPLRDWGLAPLLLTETVSRHYGQSKAGLPKLSTHMSAEEVRHSLLGVRLSCFTRRKHTVKYDLANRW